MGCEMNLQFQLNENDYVDAQLAHMRKSLAARSSFSLWAGGFIIILTTIAVIVGLIDGSTEFGRQLAPMGGLVLLVVFMILYIRSGIPYRRQFRRIKSLQMPMQLVIGNDEIAYTNANGQSKMLWSTFEDWRESKISFLLYSQPRLFYIVPKRAIPADQIPAFRSLLESRILKTR